MKAKALIAAAIVIAAGAWWLLSGDGEACPPGMNVTGPITNAETGNLLGVICMGPPKETR